MSAKASQTTVETLGQNGKDIDTMEPIRHEYDRVGGTVIAICVECATEGPRRLLQRDYDDDELFKQSLAEGDDDYVPTELWRHCDECGCKQTHLTC